MVYDYIINNYTYGDPIFLSELPGESRDYLRQEMKKLVDEGKLERLYNGVYYLPYTTILGTKGNQLGGTDTVGAKGKIFADNQMSGMIFSDQSVKEEIFSARALQGGNEGKKAGGMDAAKPLYQADPIGGSVQQEDFLGVFQAVKGDGFHRKAKGISDQSGLLEQSLMTQVDSVKKPNSNHRIQSASPPLVS